MNLFRKCIVLFLVLHLGVLSSGLSIFPKGYNYAPADEIAEKWTKMDAKLRLLVSSFIDKAVPTVQSAITDLDLSAKCQNQSQHLLFGLQNYKPWAMRFLDASGKMIDGVMVGTLSAFGSYDECLDTVVINDTMMSERSVSFEGQYCSLDFRPFLPAKNESHKLNDLLKRISFTGSGKLTDDLINFSESVYFLAYRMGVCIPSGCTLDDANKLARYMGDSTYIYGRALRCETREGKKIKYVPPIGKFALCLLIMVVLIVIAGSLMDLYSSHKKVTYTSLLHRILLSFSFVSNFKRLVNTDSTGNLSCLNGMRFLGMSWIILTHSYFMVDFQAMAAVKRAQTVVGEFAFQAIVNGTFSVDTFFFIGGLVSCYLLVKNVKLGSHGFNIFIYILHRLWRILPLYMSALLIMFLAGMIDLGPFWPVFIEDHVDVCYTSWWKNILFINNLFSYEGMCMRHSWYLACDFQLYLIALLILVPLLKSSVAGVSLSILGILISVIYSMVTIYVNDYSPVPLVFEGSQKLLENLENFFNSPLVHLGPYCVGLLTGYILAVKPKLRIPKAVQVMGWCLAFLCNFSIMYGTVDWNRGRKPLMVESIMYGGLARTSWTMGLAWMVVCCATGHGGIINYILSWPAFVPLARLSFGAYLLHPYVEAILYGSITTNLQCSQMLMVWLFFGHLCITLAFAFVGSMLIEAPFLSLEKILLRKDPKPSEAKISDLPTAQSERAKNDDQITNRQVFTPDLSDKTSPVEKTDAVSNL